MSELFMARNQQRLRMLAWISLFPFSRRPLRKAEWLAYWLASWLAGLLNGALSRLVLALGCWRFFNLRIVSAHPSQLILCSTR